MLFNAISESCKGSEVDGFVENLVQGFDQGYVKCMECGNESFTPATWQQLHLLVKSVFTKALPPSSLISRPTTAPRNSRSRPISAPKR